jgi:hypothetical protein
LGRNFLKNAERGLTNSAPCGIIIIQKGQGDTMNDMTINNNFLTEVLDCLEYLMDLAETEGEQKLVYEMTYVMKNTIEFEE